MEVLWEEHIVEIWVFRQFLKLEEFLFEYFEPWFFFTVDIPGFAPGGDWSSRYSSVRFV